MAFKMKGAPEHDTSSKHGTNANFKKTGAPLMKGLGKLAGNFIKGKGAMGILNPVGAIANRMGAFGKNNNQQAQAAQASNPNPNPPPQPAGAAPTAEEMQAAPTMMKKKSSMTMKKKDGAPMKDLSGDGKITQKDVLIGKGVIKKPKAGAPMAQRPPKGTKPKPRKPVPTPRPKPKKKTAKDFDKIIGKKKMGATMKKPGAPHTKYFGQNTTIDEVTGVSKHNRAHKSGKYDKNHQAKEGKGKYVLRPDALDKETNTGYVKADNEQKKEKKKKRDVNTAINKMTNINYKIK